MTDETTVDPQRLQLKASFKALAPTYDQLRFLQIAAQRLVDLVPIAPGARVLDVATGTGVAALAAAKRAGRDGRVVGIDLSEEMLEVARGKAAAADLPIEFATGDAEALGFDDRTFDDVICASSLFFIPDMQRVLDECRRVLVPGGHVAFSSYAPSFLQPLRGVWEARLQRYGVSAAALPTHRLNDAASCEELLRTAGFEAIDVRSEQLGYFVPGPEERWMDIVAGIEGKPLLKLAEVERDQVRREHLAELGPFTTHRGIWIDVAAIFAIGRAAV